MGLGPGTAWPFAGNGSVVAGIGLVGLFPAGVPETRDRARSARRRRRDRGGCYQFVGTIASPDTAGRFVRARPARCGQPAVRARGPFPWPRPSARCATPSPCGSLLGLVLLYLRYRRSPATARRLIRWLLAGWGTAMVVFAVLTTISLLTSGPVATVTISSCGAWRWSSCSCRWPPRCPAAACSAPTTRPARPSPTRRCGY